MFIPRDNLRELVSVLSEVEQLSLENIKESKSQGQTLLDRVAETFKIIMQAESCSILLHYPPSGRKALFLAGSAGYKRNLSFDRRLDVPLVEGKETGLAAWTARSGRPFIAQTEEEFLGHAGHIGRSYQLQWGNPKRPHKCHSLVHSPLLMDESKLTGLIKVENLSSLPTRGHRFPHAVASLITAVGLFLSETLRDHVNNSEVGFLDIKTLHVDPKVMFSDTLLRKLTRVLDRKWSSDPPIIRFVARLQTAAASIDIFEEVRNLAKDTAKCLKIRPIHDEYLSLLQRAEPALYGLGENYRDHFIHQAHDFLLGYYILKIMDRGRIVLRALRQGRFQQCSIEHVLRMWFLCCFFHDIGYAVERIDPILKKYVQDLLNHEDVQIPMFFHWPAVIDGNESATRLEEYLLLPIFDKYKVDISGQVAVKTTLRGILRKGLDHALISALILLKSSKRLIKGGLITKDMVGECAIAILLHQKSISDVISLAGKKPISFNDFPIAVLLAFCDELQQWGRPPTHLAVEETEQSYKLSKAILDSSPQLTELDFNNKSGLVSAKLRYNTKPEYFEKGLFRRHKRQLQRTWRGNNALEFRIQYVLGPRAKRGESLMFRRIGD